MNLERKQGETTVPDDYFFNQLYLHPRLVELARAVLGDDVSHFMSRLLLKDGDVADAIQCHQDWPYFSGNTNKLSVMIPLTARTQANGKLYFVEKSHFYGPMTRGPLDPERFPDLLHAGPDLEVGDVFVHDWLTWHYSVPSQDRSDRAVIQIVYQPSSDPSSPDLVCGQKANPFACRNWDDPVSRVDSPWTVGIARSLWQSGKPDRAAKICEGIITGSDSDRLSGYALLAEIAVAEGRLADAEELLGKLKAGYSEFAATIDELDQRIRATPPATP